MSAAASSCTLACPACGGLAVEVYLDAEDRPPAASEFGSSRRHIVPGKILRCRACGFGFRRVEIATTDNTADARPGPVHQYETGIPRTIHVTNLARRIKALRHPAETTMRGCARPLRRCALVSVKVASPRPRRIR